MLPDQEKSQSMKVLRGGAGFMAQSTSQPAVSHYNVVLTLMHEDLHDPDEELLGPKWYRESLLSHWITEIYRSYV